jgi:hypothetical protein
LGTNYEDKKLTKTALHKKKNSTSSIELVPHFFQTSSVFWVELEVFFFFFFLVFGFVGLLRSLTDDGI